MFDSYQLKKHKAELAEFRLRSYAEAEGLMGQPAWRRLEPDLRHARTRLDLMWDGSELGLKVHQNGGIEFEPIHDFDNADPAILAMSQDLRRTCPHKGIMNLRFRVGPGGLRGLWIDAPRTGLEELKSTHRSWIRSLLDQGIVLEAGQRGEEWVLSENGDDFAIKSTRPKLRVWLPSYTREGEPIPILSTLVAFSQPGPLANQTILRAGHELLDLVSEWPAGFRWGEWGAGSGNLSASFASRLGAENAWISEPDPRAFAALKHNHGAHFAGARLERSAAIRAPENFYLWILDPPRSGFSDLIRSLQPEQRPQHILIYHCAAAGLASDRSALLERGYALREWVYCDVFPGSAHCEAISLWSREG